ncbi:unnamed protein product [Paramecium sonneborni]|uniref:Uncharacterized protein n=1 Tax=Paramecium sonneborni TaxID=65129 RepID=A0A8S1QRC8_9CILI|nr:unnamed protein product [Paramecium sonneborni]
MLKIIALSLIYIIIFVLSVILMIVQQRVKRLRHNPGQILFWILLSQTIMSMFMVFGQFYVVGEANQSNMTITISDISCKLIAVPNLIASMLYAILNILLIANLYCQINVQNYKKFKLKGETMLAVTLIIIISILLVLLSQDLGVRRLQFRVLECVCCFFSILKRLFIDNYIDNIDKIIKIFA